MNESEVIVDEFEKLLQTLDAVCIDLRLDLIAKIESKLNEYKSRIESKRNDCNSRQLTPNNSESHLNSEQSLPLIVDNCPQVCTELNNDLIDNTLTQNVCTAEDNQSIEPIVCQTGNQIGVEEKRQTRSSRKALICGDNGNYELPKTTDNCQQNLTEVSNKVVTKRKWRRTLDINDLKCKYCGKMWRSLSHLEIHLRSHTGEKIYECPKCGQRFAQLAGLQVHLRRHNNDRRFVCEVCGKAFYTRIDLSRHKTSHKQFKQITQCCEICGKGFSDKRKVRNHIRYVHEKKESVVCEICGHKTHGQHLLYAHKRAKHERATEIACPVCSQVIASKSAFVIHLRSHAEVKPCACDTCGKLFRSKSQVSRHKLTHEEGRHVCDICAKKFKTSHHLKRHKIIHFPEEKPFECHLCDYKCNVNSNIVKHVKSVHGIVTFSLISEDKRTSAKPTDEDALKKGSMITQQVLKEIAITKGEKITVKELKRLDEKKKREKELNIKKMCENRNHRKPLIRRRFNKLKKDILDDAFNSTFNDNNHNDSTGARNEAVEPTVGQSVDTNAVALLLHIAIPTSDGFCEVQTTDTQTNDTYLRFSECPIKP